MDEADSRKSAIAPSFEAMPLGDLIHDVRGCSVMLDSDLALLYQVETKRINESVRRNQARFPEEFCFQLTREEHDALRSQFATSNNTEGRGGRRYQPRVFTEQGIAMLSAVLHSDVAIEVSVRIMKAFVEMRRLLASDARLFQRMKSIELRQMIDQEHNEERFERVFGYLEERIEPRQRVFFEGQLYDAFSLLVELVQKAKHRIVLIDGYVDTETLNILAKKNECTSAVVYTRKGARLSQTDIKVFNEQYPSLRVCHTNAFHDQFLILDDGIGYHIGASVKDAGKKAFAINRIEDDATLHAILQRAEA